MENWQYLCTRFWEMKVFIPFPPSVFFSSDASLVLKLRIQ